MSNETNNYPRRVRCMGTELELRMMTAGDAEAVLAFAAALPPHDLIFLQRDIRNSKVVSPHGSNKARAARSRACSRWRMAPFAGAPPSSGTNSAGHRTWASFGSS